MKKAKSIILIIVIIFIKFILYSFGKPEEVNRIDVLQISHASLFFPFYFVIYELIHNLFNKGKNLIKLQYLVIFMLVWIVLNLILGYYDRKIINYNFLIGNVIGLVLTVIIYPILTQSKER